MSLDEGHGVVRHAVRLAGVEDAEDVRVLELGGELDLALEAFDADALHELGRKDFDDDFASEGGLGGDEDARHAAAAELSLEGIAAAE